MCSKNENERKDLLRDLFLHAPIGILYELADAFPEAVKRGKSQVQISKLLVQMAAQKNKKEVESSIEDLLKEAGQLFVKFGEKLETACDDTSEEPNDEPESSEPVSVAVDEPFAGYDSLNAREVIKRLSKVDPSTLQSVLSYEEANKSRKSVLEKIKSLQD